MNQWIISHAAEMDMIFYVSVTIIIFIAVKIENRIQNKWK